MAGDIDSFPYFKNAPSGWKVSYLSLVFPALHKPNKAIVVWHSVYTPFPSSFDSAPNGSLTCTHMSPCRTRFAIIYH